jgi:lipopolysaccharide/colanic/teichoic acid biosynthesis glycosyltransferase
VRALLDCRLYGIRVTDIGGWAQLNYPYGASVEDARRKLEYDLYYVKNCNVFLDLLILVQTLRMVIWPHGVR